MRQFMDWWYAFSLPKRGPDTTPRERERTRYARLTSAFLLLVCVIFIPVSPIMIFFSPNSPSSPVIGVGVILLLICAFGFGKAGWNYLCAACIITYNIICVTAVLLTNPLDPSLLPLFGVFSISIILAGALMPPIASLVVSILCCLNILFISQVVPHTVAYQQMLDKGLFTITLIAPIGIQLMIGVVSFVIMRSLINTIHRADRAEEIISLQQELARHVRTQIHQKQQLEEGVQQIAETHARISNGDLSVRVNLTEGHALWNVAGSLNNLLNRLQRMKGDADMLVATRHAAYQISNMLHQAVIQGKIASVHLPTTGTPLDPVIMELNNVTRSALSHSISRDETRSEHRL